MPPRQSDLRGRPRWHRRAGLRFTVTSLDGPGETDSSEMAFAAREGSNDRQIHRQHMTAILVAFFGVVVVVNFTMAGYASSTFGGIVVENSYVASQHFNRWLDEARAEDRLGWDAVTAWRPDGRLAITVTGALRR
jgi:hypothetical protein